MKISVQKSENAVRVLHLLSNLTIKKVVDFLKENGPSFPSEIAKKLDISPSTASRILQKLKSYELVRAKWKTDSVEERPLKMYELVPNILRCEIVLNEPREIEKISPEDIITFNGNTLTFWKENGKKGAYVSMETIPFRFEGMASDIIKECTRNPTFENLKLKFRENQEEFKLNFKKLLTLGIIGIKKEEL